MTVDIKQIPQIVQEAKNAAHQAATNYFHEVLRGQDRFACGFAWIHVSEKGSTKMGRALMQNGFEKAYRGGLEMWNPSGLSVQNIDVKEIGANAAVAVLRKYGINAYTGSRLD